MLFRNIYFHPKTRFLRNFPGALLGPKYWGALSFVLKGAYRALRHWLDFCLLVSFVVLEELLL